MITCYEFNDIKLEQSETGERLFRVTYGKMIIDDLCYSDAANELGKCILHHLCCESLASNEGA